MFSLPNEVSVDSLEDDGKKVPMPTEEGWQDYVLSLLWKDEYIIDERGNKRPRTAGLARVFEVVMGEVIEGRARVIESGPERAVVEYRLVFKPNKYFDDKKSFTEVSEVNDKNTQSPYINYAVPSAATVAEGRAYKKAMKLRVYTAEEIDPQPDNMEKVNKIDEGQISVINMLIGRCKIDKEKYLKKLGDVFKGWSSFEDYTSKAANLVIESLNSYVQKTKPIPEDIRREE